MRCHKDAFRLIQTYSSSHDLKELKNGLAALDASYSEYEWELNLRNLASYSLKTCDKSLLNYCISNGFQFNFDHDVVTSSIQSFGDRIDILAFLQRCGVDLHSERDHNLVSPLHIAARENCCQSIRFLISQGADPNERAGDDDELSPLDVAIDHRHLEALTALLECGASPSNVNDSLGMSALDRAKRLDWKEGIDVLGRFLA